MTALAVHRYPCQGDTCQGPLVLLHGWGNSARVWTPWLPALTRHFQVLAVDLPGYGQSPGTAEDYADEALLARLAEVLPERCHLLGWSLGGMLAANLAARCPARVASLTTLATNARFVASEDWAPAMHPVQFHAFAMDVSRVPDTALRRFSSFQVKGEGDERALIQQLRSLAEGQPVPSGEVLRASLERLAALDLRAVLPGLPMPQRHFLGERDTLVPVAAAEALRALGETVQVTVLDAAHLPFLSQPDAILDALCSLPSLPPLPESGGATQAVDKQVIAESFSRAASTYDSVAELQRQVGDTLLGLLPDTLRPASVLDVGSGTGYFTAQLARRFAVPTLGLDLARGMLLYARHHRQVQQVSWLCGDAESLPAATGSIGLVYSSLAVQWCARLEDALREMARVLAPGGVCAIATLLPGTLRELGSAWQAVDSDVHVNSFLPCDEVLAAVGAAGLAVVTQREQCHVMRYRELRELVHSIKGIGAHNMNDGRPRGLTPRHKWQALTRAYEAFRQPDGGLPASYQVLYLVLQRPARRTAPVTPRRAFP